MYSLRRGTALFSVCLVSVLVALVAADPCPAQSNGLKCDYIDELAHNNSKGDGEDLGGAEFV